MTTPNVFQTVSISERCCVAIFDSLRRNARFLLKCIFQKCVTNLSYGPFTLAIFVAILAAISSAILWRFKIDRVNYWRFRSDSLHGRLEIAAKIAGVNGLLGVSRL